VALVTFNPAIAALRGKVGEWVYRHWYRTPRVQKAPDFSHRILSPDQQAQVERFRVAAKAAPAMLAAHKRACQRKARVERKSEISVAFQACYYHQPLKDLPGDQPIKP
jgi:hypothetical protein